MEPVIGTWYMPMTYIHIYAYDLVHSYDDIGGDGALQLLLVRPLLSHLLLNLLQRQWLLAL